VGKGRDLLLTFAIPYIPQEQLQLQSPAHAVRAVNSMQPLPNYFGLLFVFRTAACRRDTGCPAFRLPTGIFQHSDTERTFAVWSRGSRRSRSSISANTIRHEDRIFSARSSRTGYLRRNMSWFVTSFFGNTSCVLVAITLSNFNRVRPLNLHGLIWLLMMVWSKRGNINTAALVTTARCNTLVARCSRQLIGPADWVFVTLGPLRCD